MFGKKKAMIDREAAMPGRAEMMAVPEAHFVNGHRIQAPFPQGIKTLVVAMGCFWGAERIFWQLDGVYATAVGYAGGYSSNPTYREVCSGQTGHTEVVLVAYDPDKISFDAILKAFWEGHDPTQGMRQGNDVGTQYRSAVYVNDGHELELVEASRDRYQAELSRAGFGEITTEIAIGGPFYYAEDYHQQYLAKNVNGYCGIGGTGVSCPTGLAAG